MTITVDDWCITCRQHRASIPGGQCPVCAPTGDLLDRIDAALAAEDQAPAGRHQASDASGFTPYPPAPGSFGEAMAAITARVERLSEEMLASVMTSTAASDALQRALRRARADIQAEIRADGNAAVDRMNVHLAAADIMHGGIPAHRVGRLTRPLDDPGSLFVHLPDGVQPYPIEDLGPTRQENR